MTEHSVTTTTKGKEHAFWVVFPIHPPHGDFSELSHYDFCQISIEVRWDQTKMLESLKPQMKSLHTPDSKVQFHLRSGNRNSWARGEFPGDDHPLFSWNRKMRSIQNPYIATYIHFKRQVSLGRAMTSNRSQDASIVGTHKEFLVLGD